MKITDAHDTIAAIGTALGESGIGIVRVSGKNALKIADRVFISKAGKKPSQAKTYTTHYGWVKKQGQTLDEVILTVMRSPRSYTKEDVVEINCHGGIAALRRVLEFVLEKNCRLAEPGEFTKRAFLNGRIDLAQAEGVLDIIRARTDAALRVGVEQLRGGLSKEINRLRELLLEALSVLEAGIDFPEEETGKEELDGVSRNLKNVRSHLDQLIESGKQGRMFREGLHVVICGKTNVGKSSLLNALLREDRSIVTPVAGTTRDTIEEVIDIKGIPVRLMDTAGIITPRDLVEKKAVLRAKKNISSADLVLLVFDGSRRLSREDMLLIDRLKGRQTIAVINKMDLRQKIERGRIEKKFASILQISARKSKNIGLLEEEIYALSTQGKIEQPASFLVGNLRHLQALKSSKNFIAQALHSLDNKLSWEFIAQDVCEALKSLDSVLGKTFSEDLLDRIFSEFCIGK